MEDKLKRLNDIKTENFIWIIYLVIIFLSYYANSKEKNYILYNDQKSRQEYQTLLIIIFGILLIVYLYYVIDSYNEIKNLKYYDTAKKKNLTYASFIGSFLVLLSGIIFLTIAIIDDEINVEIAFN